MPYFYSDFQSLRESESNEQSLEKIEQSNEHSFGLAGHCKIHEIHFTTKTIVITVTA